MVVAPDGRKVTLKDIKKKSKQTGQSTSAPGISFQMPGADTMHVAPMTGGSHTRGVDVKASPGMKQMDAGAPTRTFKGESKPFDAGKALMSMKLSMGAANEGIDVPKSVLDKDSPLAGKSGMQSGGMIVSPDHKPKSVSAEVSEGFGVGNVVPAGVYARILRETAGQRIADEIVRTGKVPPGVAADKSGWVSIAGGPGAVGVPGGGGAAIATHIKGRAVAGGKQEVTGQAARTAQDLNTQTFQQAVKDVQAQGEGAYGPDFNARVRERQQEIIAGLPKDQQEAMSGYQTVTGRKPGAHPLSPGAKKAPAAPAGVAPNVIAKLKKFGHQLAKSTHKKVEAATRHIKKIEKLPEEQRKSFPGYQKYLDGLANGMTERVAAAYAYNVKLTKPERHASQEWARRSAMDEIHGVKIWADEEFKDYRPGWKSGGSQKEGESKQAFHSRMLHKRWDTYRERMKMLGYDEKQAAQFFGASVLTQPDWSEESGPDPELMAAWDSIRSGMKGVPAQPGENTAEAIKRRREAKEKPAMGSEGEEIEQPKPKPEPEPETPQTGPFPPVPTDESSTQPQKEPYQDEAEAILRKRELEHELGFHPNPYQSTMPEDQPEQPESEYQRLLKSAMLEAGLQDMVAVDQTVSDLAIIEQVLADQGNTEGVQERTAEILNSLQSSVGRGGSDADRIARARRAAFLTMDLSSLRDAKGVGIYMPKRGGSLNAKQARALFDTFRGNKKLIREISEAYGWSIPKAPKTKG